MKAMQRTSSGSGHRLGRLRNRLTDIYPTSRLKQLDGYAEVLHSETELQLDDFPYPVFEFEGTYQLHLCSQGEDLRFLLVDKESAEVLGEHHSEYTFWQTASGIRDVADGVLTAAERSTGDKAPPELEQQIQVALSEDELLHSPFNAELNAKLRPPVIRWLRTSTKDVVLDTVEFTGGKHVKTNFEITFEPLREGSDRTVTVRADKILSQDLQKFRGEYNRELRPSPRLRIPNSWWFDITRYWVAEASVSDFADDVLTDLAADGLSWQESQTRKQHLRLEDEETTLCGSTVDSEAVSVNEGETLFSPLACSHCYPEYKRQQLMARL